MEKDKGGNLIEYILPLGLIGIVVGMGIYLSNDFLTQFIAGSSNAKYDKTTGKLSLQSTCINNSQTAGLQAGSLGGTTDQPVSKCFNDTCTVDFGEFVLTGLPANFQDFVQSGGTSGGTNKLASLFEQIARQLEKEGNLTGSKKFKDLANLGHYVAVLQKTIEKSAEKNTGGSEFGINLNVSPVPDNISHLIPQKYNFGLGSTIPDWNFVLKMSAISLPGSRSDGKERIYPGATMNLLYKDIMADKSISDNIKKVAKETMLMMYTLSKESRALIEPGLKPDRCTYIDSESLLKPHTSIKSNITSVFICTTGKNDDTGKACH